MPPDTISADCDTGMRSVSVGDLAAMLGLPPTWVDAHVAEDDLSPLRWSRLAIEERDATILLAIRQLESRDLPTATPAAKARWERGWGEVLARIAERGVSEDTLRPQYFRHETVRLMGDYARVERPEFEYRLYRTIADLLFRRHLQGADAVVEFACGTGINLLHLGRRFPGIRLFGCDWSTASQAILSQMAVQHRLDLSACNIDLWTGAGFDQAVFGGFGRLAVITMHGLEQIGWTFDPFMRMALALKPALIMHLEPLVELYRPDSLFDALAIRYHDKRGYLRGLLPAVRRLQDEGRAEILAERRLGFGSAFHEGYSLLVWRPVRESRH